MNYIKLSRNLVRAHLLRNLNFIVIMTEGNLHTLSLDELFDLLMKRTEELIYFNCTEHAIEYQAKKEEVQLIQRFIVVKRAEFPPLV